jgi:putative ABC transport system permease protein
LRWLESALVAGEIACGVSLFAAAVLLSAEFLRLAYKEPGYDARGLYLVNVVPARRDSITPAQGRLLAAAARERMAAVPGVIASTIGSTYGTWPVRLDDGKSRLSRDESPLLMGIDERFFRALGTPLVSGRDFTAGDRAGAPPVAIVNEAAAANFWPGRPAIGHKLFVDDTASTAEWLTVIGVVANAKVVNTHQLTGPLHPIVYRPFDQAPRKGARLFVRMPGDSARVVHALLAAVRDITHRPSERGYSVGSMEWEIDFQLHRQRFSAIALAGFAAFALLLAAMGVYGVVAYAVTQRTREIGIRMALGAEREAVLALIARRGMGLGVVGVAVGIAASFAMLRLLRSLVVGAGSISPLAIASSAVVLLMVTFAATYVPARRATRVDPMVALRAE